MSETRKSPSTTVLSRFFDKNVCLVAGVCSKCYLDEEDVKIIAVNKKFLKQVEERKKLKRAIFLHDDYPCEDDYISRKTSENDVLELSQTTTFTSHDYTLITADTSHSRQTKPRLNCYNNSNSACGTEVTTLCTKTEKFIESGEKVSNKANYRHDNKKVETKESISNIRRNHNDLNGSTTRSNLDTQNCIVILDTYKLDESNGSSYDNNSNCSTRKENNLIESEELSGNISYNSDNVDLLRRDVKHNLCFQNTRYNEDYFQDVSQNHRSEFRDLSVDSSLFGQNSLTFQDIQESLSPYPTHSQNDILNIQTNASSSKSDNCFIIQDSTKNYCNLKSNSDCLKSKNDDQDGCKFLNKASDVSNSLNTRNNMDILKLEIKNESDRSDVSDITSNLKIQNSKINLLKLSQSNNSQKPKWMSLSDNMKIKTETDIKSPLVNVKDENCNSTIINENENKEIKRTINLAKLKIKNDSHSGKPSWIPPRSPHNLIEESLFHDPWSLLIATIFLNKTSCMCARPRVEEFLNDFSEPLDVIKEHPVKLEKYFLDLGLHKRRAEQVWRMSYDYAYKHWRNPRELYGIGKYGEDAYRMFILGDLNIEPTDRFLRIYRDWARMKQKEDMNAAFPDS